MKERKKERKQTTQGRDGRTARRHHTGILRRGVWCASHRPPLGVRLFLSHFAVSPRFSLQPSCHLAVSPFSSFSPLSFPPLSRRSLLPRPVPPPPAGPLFSSTSNKNERISFSQRPAKEEELEAGTGPGTLEASWYVQLLKGNEPAHALAPATHPPKARLVLPSGVPADVRERRRLSRRRPRCALGPQCAYGEDCADCGKRALCTPAGTGMELPIDALRRGTRTLLLLS